MTIPAIFDANLIRAHRERAARAGAMPDFLLSRVGEEMAERLSGIDRAFAPILAVGAMPGVLSTILRQRGGDGAVIEMEASPALLPPGAAPALCGEEERLPFKDASLGLIVSGLTLQLANDLPGTLVQIRRALKPDGLFLGALLGGQTLAELREAFIEAETELEGGASPRVMPTGDVRDYGALLQRAGFALPVADSDLITVTYSSPLALMRDLRAMGAANALTQRRRTFLRRATFLRALEIYQERFPAEKDGRVKASFEVIYLAGWGPDESQQKPLRPGSAAARLADALGVEEHKLKG